MFLVKSVARWLAFTTLCSTIGFTTASANANTAESTSEVPYLNTALSIEQRVDDLVARMTTSEKIAQMYNEAPAIERLGIPEYNWWNEALHGVARAGKATVFPQAIGLAAMWDRELHHEIATAISDEGRAKYHNFIDNDVVFRYTGLTFWSPNINIFRDPRWGRGQETYGEDPYLTGELAVEFIQGLQGDDPKYLKTAAMAKHFAVHSGPEKSRHSDDYHPSDKDLYETYLPAFEKAVVEANVESVMCAYNRVNGEPACGNSKLLKDILRDRYQFDGHVVSDCGAIWDFYRFDGHRVVKSPAAAAARAVRTGTDLNCGTDHLSVFSNLHFALQRGLITEQEIDTAVKRLFHTRFKLGMFDPQDAVPFSKLSLDQVGSTQHLTLTETAAEKSFVLLKNDGVLPLDKNISVAVIGPNATNPTVLIGNYNGEPINPVTPLAGIQSYLGENNVSYAPGSALAQQQYSHFDVVGPENFFHDNNGVLEPGLIANYYAINSDGPHESSKRTTETTASISRVDANIDFYWSRSPLDNSLRDEFTVQWSGVLVPQNSGEYEFKTRETLTINGKEVRGPITLNAGEHYVFSAEQTFLRTWWGNPIDAYAQLRWINHSRDLQTEAIAAGKKADVIIFMGGISADLEGEEMPVSIKGFDHGDRTDIELPKAQKKLLRKLRKLGKPIVLVNFSGSAMALNWEDKNLNAIVQGFYPGEATGTALAKLLWGDTNPSGRLPITFYKGLNDLPGFKDYTMENRTYRYYRGTPLYPFGYGLSYSNFGYSQLVINGEAAQQTPITIVENTDIELTVKLTNSSERAGEEVSQVYLSLLDAPIATPQRQLVEFNRSELNGGDTKQLQFTIPASAMTYIDNQGNTQNYFGRAKLTVGSGQAPYLAATQYREQIISIVRSN